MSWRCLFKISLFRLGITFKTTFTDRYHLHQFHLGHLGSLDRLPDVTEISHISQNISDVISRGCKMIQKVISDVSGKSLCRVGEFKAKHHCIL